MAKRERPNMHRGVKIGAVIGRQECSYCGTSVPVRLNAEWQPKLQATCPTCDRRERAGERETEEYLDQLLAKKETPRHDDPQDDETDHTPEDDAPQVEDHPDPERAGTKTGKPARDRRDDDGPTGIGML